MKQKTRLGAHLRGNAKNKEKKVTINWRGQTRRRSNTKVQTKIKFKDALKNSKIKTKKKSEDCRCNQNIKTRRRPKTLVRNWRVKGRKKVKISLQCWKLNLF